VLADADVRRVVQAAVGHDADFGALVLVLAATGARLDQTARLTVADLQPEAGRIMVPASRKGRGAKQVTHIAVPLPEDVVARLRPLATGRMSHEPLLTRWRHRQVKGDEAAGTQPRWERDVRRPWTSSAEMTRPWRAALAAAGLPAGLVPYCLRHSSIARGLRAGLPVRLVAAVHDTSAAMVERHYGAFIVDATEDLLRRAVVPLAPAVQPLVRLA
jgi:integrase